MAHLKRRSDTEKGKEAGVSWDLSDSFHLRLLIHYIGDIHQPLHASSRYTLNYPSGDEGGNDFLIKVVNKGHG